MQTLLRPAFLFSPEPCPSLYLVSLAASYPSCEPSCFSSPVSLTLPFESCLSEPQEMPHLAFCHSLRRHLLLSCIFSWDSHVLECSILIYSDENAQLV